MHGRGLAFPGVRMDRGRETVERRLEMLPYECSAWIGGDAADFRAPTTSLVARDRFDRRVVLFQSKWDKQAAARMSPAHELLDYA